MNMKYLVLCFISIMSCCFIGSGQTKINQSIECSWLEYDYGTLTIGDTASCTLVIKNISNKTLEIVHVINGCSCISTVINTRRLRPEKEAVISIKFCTEKKQPGENYQNIAICTSDQKVYSFILKAFLRQ